MSGILSDLQKTVVTGIVLTIVLFILIRLIVGTGFALDHAWFAFFFRWLHVLSGVMWIGLLWASLRPSSYRRSATQGECS